MANSKNSKLVGEVTLQFNLNFNTVAKIIQRCLVVLFSGISVEIKQKRDEL